MIENSRKKLEKKHVDMIAANNLKEAGAGFAVDTNLADPHHPGRGKSPAPDEQGGSRRRPADGDSGPPVNAKAILTFSKASAIIKTEKAGHHIGLPFRFCAKK